MKACLGISYFLLHFTRFVRTEWQKDVFSAERCTLPQQLAGLNVGSSLGSLYMVRPTAQVHRNLSKIDRAFAPNSPTLVYYTTGGHFACACVHPLKDNSVGASNLMAGNRKLALRYGPLKAISLVL